MHQSHSGPERIPFCFIIFWWMSEWHREQSQVKQLATGRAVLVPARAWHDPGEGQLRGPVPVSAPPATAHVLHSARCTAAIVLDSTA